MSVQPTAQSAFGNLAARVRGLSVIGLALVMFGGCKDLEGFDTKDGTAFCGPMISATAFQEGFVRAGQPPSLQLRLELDIDRITTNPGVITSNDGNDPQSLCGELGMPLFQQAALRPIEELFHDPLSALEFGEGRDHNFFAWIDSTCKGPVLALVSLMKNDKVEVRLFKPAPAPVATTPRENKPGFALFHLSRQAEACF